MTRTLLIAGLLTAALRSNPALALTADEIIDKAREAQSVDSSIQQVRMVLVSKNDAERVREFEMRVRKDDDIVSTYVRFSHPTDVAGTQLVIVDTPGTADEQLLYLPALKRVSRIAGKARTGSFMGSDFSYEDLEFSYASGASHTLTSEDDSAWVIDTIPGDGSSYSKLRVHVAKSDYLPRKVEFFDKKGNALKVLEVTETAVDGGATIPVKSEMKNLQRGTRTRLETTEHRLNVPAEEIPAETFTAAWMESHG